MKLLLAATVLAVSCVPAWADSCLSESALRAIDQAYEEALRTGDRAYLQKLLATNFIWVHNLAVTIESRPVLLARLEVSEEIPIARTTSDVSLHRLANTVVLSGLSSVEKRNSDGKTSRISRYRFIRTYVKNGNDCQLLAVQTMKVWSSDSAPVLH